MSECLNTVGFVFNSVKTYIKKDKSCKYTQFYCQDCAFANSCVAGCAKPVPGVINPCNKCTNNTQYKICIFKLKKEDFVSSTISISTDTTDAWEQFKKNIIYQRNGNFVISVTDCKNKFHSFWANLIKAKKCPCCESVVLYFKYNIISLTNPQFLTNPYTPPDVTVPEPSPYYSVCANKASNISYNLKSGTYKTVRFFNSQNYNFENTLAQCVPICNPCAPLYV